MKSAHSFNIPFLKFKIDPEVIDGLRLIKHESLGFEEPEEVYLFENPSARHVYCVWEEVQGGSPFDFEKTVKEFAGDRFKIFEVIEPNHTDWLQTHTIIRVA